MAVIYNNETNTFDEVIEALMVHFDSRTTCEGVAAVIKSFGIRTDVEPEWKE